MELRDIEIFLALAEDLHFGHAAARLHVSQARVSQAIAQQERRLGGLLFDRSNRRQVRLTPLGHQLRADLRPVYADLRDSLERARLAARGVTAVLRIGMLPLNVHGLQPYWKRFTTLHPQWELRIRIAPFVDPFAALRTGDLDVLIAWLPVDEPDLTTGPVLCTDSRVLAVPRGHELVTRSAISVEMLSDFPHASAARVPAYWEDAYLPFHTPRGRLIERVQTVANREELVNLVTTGETVHTFPSHVTEWWAMPQIEWLSIPDMPALSYAMVWRSETENDPIRAFARIVRDLGPLDLTRKPR